MTKIISFTQLPNIIWDRNDLTVYERIILVHIIRKTIGWGKTSDGISISQFALDLGISKNTVIKSIKSLCERGFITKIKTKKINGAQSFNRYEISQSIVDQVNGESECESETDTNKQEKQERPEKPEKQKRSAFVHPTEAEINRFATENDLLVTGMFDYYESNGWMVGKNKMRNWQAAARSWNKREREQREKHTDYSSGITHEELTSFDFLDGINRDDLTSFYL